MMTQRILIALMTASMATFAVGCTQDPSAPVEDANAAAADDEDASFILGGKADGGGISPCIEQNILAWVNDITVDVEELKAQGVHTRASKRIVAHRDGADKVPGTEDDNTIDDLKELDDIKYVGPRALEQLTAAVEDRCTAVQVETIFSPQPSENSHTTRAVELIEGAQHSIDVAMYSFRDNKVRDALADAVGRGVIVRMIFQGALDDRRDPEGTASAAFEDRGIDVRYVNKIMHHKFLLVDGPTEDLADASTAWLLTGSANFSSSAATRYDENTVVIRGNQELALTFQREFNHLWDNSRNFDAGAGLEASPSLPIEDTDLIDDPNVEAVFTSANFKITQRSQGPTFTRVRGNQAIADRIVALIEGATDSIWIASGHLRSRPISEALIKKADENPQMDIRLYLDAQEYISDSKQNSQTADLEECLVEAEGSATRTEDCLTSGYYFSHDAKESEGIDVRFKWYSYRWHYRTAIQLHHKYLIIDGDTVISGSYNLSGNAEFDTIENTIVYTGAQYQGLVEDFQANFLSIWDTGIEENLYETLMDEILNGTGDVPIVHSKAMALTWEQVRDYRSAVNQVCSDVNSAELRNNADRHFFCTRK